jgi:hypothetical protein
LPRGSLDGCEAWGEVEGDVDWDFAWAWFERGGDTGNWPGSYSPYKSSGCDEGPSRRCYYGENYTGNGWGNDEVQGGDTLEIDDWNSSSVSGTIEIDGEDIDFEVVNCGQTSLLEKEGGEDG